MGKVLFVCGSGKGDEGGSELDISVYGVGWMKGRANKVFGLMGAREVNGVGDV